MSMNWHTEWSACQRKRKPYSCLPKPKYLLLWLNWDIKAGKSAASDVLRLSRQDGESRSLRKPRAHVGVNPDNQISDILRDRDYMGNPSKAVKDFEKAIASLEKRRKSRIFSVVHTAHGSYRPPSSRRLGSLPQAERERERSLRRLLSRLRSLSPSERANLLRQKGLLGGRVFSP